MQKFTTTIKRLVTIRSSDRALSDKKWVLEIGASGVRIRRFGESEDDSMRLSWRSVISHALIHVGDEVDRKKK